MIAVTDGVVHIDVLEEYVRQNFPGWRERKVRFRRTDGLVDGGVIDHVSDLESSRRKLHDTLDPSWGTVR